MILALVSLACRINIPIREIKTGPTQTQEIQVAAPTADNAALTLAFGAGELKLTLGAGDALVSGMATYNVDELKPVVTTEGNRTRIATGELQIKGIPNFGNNFKNEWDLKLGDLPINLHINSGAYKGDMELGGLALQSLDVSDGASDVTVNFSEPNKMAMGDFRYETGASTVELNDLGNANFSAMTFRGGAGEYTLNFSGQLQRDAYVSIKAGISQVNLIVPDGVPATVTFKGGLSNVDHEGTWQQTADGSYTLTGSGPSLNITVDMGAGNLKLSNH